VVSFDLPGESRKGYYAFKIQIALKRFFRMIRFIFLLFGCFLLFCNSATSEAWFDETHVAIAMVAGYSKWFNAAGPDMIKKKMGNREGHNHFVNNPRRTVITPEMVLAQAEKYNKIDRQGHLYGAIIASVRDYIKEKEREVSMGITIWHSAPIMLLIYPSPSIISNIAFLIWPTIRR